MVGYRIVVLEVLGSIPTDRPIWFSKMFFSFKVRQKIRSPTISVYSAIYNISGEIRRNRLNISENQTGDRLNINSDIIILISSALFLNCSRLPYSGKRWREKTLVNSAV